MKKNYLFLFLISIYTHTTIAATITATNHVGTTITKPVTNFTGIKKWSEASSWVGGIKPQAGDNVIIPQNAVILLDEVNIDIADLNIAGMLIVDITKPIINLSVNNIMLMNDMGITNKAYFQWGLPTEKYTGKGTITLKGAATDANLMGMGSKVLALMNDAEIQLHGKDKKSWTQLGASCISGANTITLKETVDWEIGDRIVIASTDFDMNQAEEKTITNVSTNAGRTTLTLNSALQFGHYGQLQNYTHGKDATLNWVLDERAEVGLLSKSILIQGDLSSETSFFGGHVMLMGSARANISNVEFFRMGQRGRLGRYPFHWHFVTNGVGQSISKSSVHHTYNRAITVHGTNDVTVTENVAYDNLGHAYFMEDGIEERVTMTNNLGLVTRRPPAAFAIIPSDISNARNISGPSTFWITNPRNTVTGNHAAGSDGSGIWYAPFNNPNGARYNSSYQPLNFAIPDGTFDNNVMHSNTHGFILGSGPNAGNASETPNENNGINPPPNSKPTIKNMLVYKNSLGAYTRTRPGNNQESYYENFIVADNRVGEAATWRTFYNKVLWVVGSDNYSTNYTNPAVGGNVTAAHIVYDGPVITTNSHFAGTTRAGQSMFDQWGANIKYTGHNFTNTTVEPTSYRVNFRDSATDRVNPVWFLASVRDVDGRLIGSGSGAPNGIATPNSTISKNHPYLMNATSTPLAPTNNNGVSTVVKFGYVEGVGSDHLSTAERLANPNVPDRPDMSVIRSDNGGQYSDQSGIEGYPVTTILDNNEVSSRYMLKKQIPSRTMLNIHSMSAGETFIIEYPNCPPTIKLFLGDEVAESQGVAMGNNRVAITQVANFDAVKAANSTCYAWENGTAYVKYRAPTGVDYTEDAIIKSIFLCLYNNCTNGPTGSTNVLTHAPAVVADFDRLDTRGTISRVSGTVNFALPAFTSGAGGSNYYEVTNNGDATNGCVEYRLAIRMQNWEKVPSIGFNTIGAANSQIYLEDASTSGRILLGTFGANNGPQTFSLNSLTAAQKDQITAIIIRTCENNFTGNQSRKVFISELRFGDALPTIFTEPTNLPVDLISFTGKKTISGIELNWVTASEKNNERFDLLKSTTANDFVRITSVAGKGTSDVTNQYSYLDAFPAEGTNYYKLNQVDFDGKTTPSNIVAVDMNLAAGKFEMYVAEQDLIYSVYSNATNQATIEIVDITGRTINAITINLQAGLTNGKIPLHFLSQGIYVAKLKVDEKVLVKKFVR